jgi:hypothetical protein
MVKNLRLLLLISSITFLNGCGGGGGSPAPNVSAEGVWTGTTSTNYAVDVLVLENNQFWSMFGNRSASSGSLTVVGFDQGSGTVSGSTFSGNLLEVIYTGATDTGSITATTVANTSLNGSASYHSGNRSTFNLAPPSSSAYNYNTAASLATIQGNWSGSLLSGASATVAITSSGVISGTSAGASGSCSFTGKVTPRASGKNVFDASLTFGASPCALPNQTANGIALAYTTSTNQTQLLMSVVDSGRTTGTMFFASR